MNLLARHSAGLLIRLPRRSEASRLRTRPKQSRQPLTMRLKLTVKRHKLPSVDLLWAVSDDNSKKASTVAALLEEVNTIIPLETEDWGLDDYVVELGDFEALHFQKITAIFGNDDHVT